jgi:hypothetical protein
MAAGRRGRGGHIHHTPSGSGALDMTRDSLARPRGGPPGEAVEWTPPGGGIPWAGALDLLRGHILGRDSFVCGIIQG